jgi:hypothetical protein
MFAGCLQIMPAHYHLIRAENADVCRPQHIPGHISKSTTDSKTKSVLTPNKKTRAMHATVYLGVTFSQTPQESKIVKSKTFS